MALPCSTCPQHLTPSTHGSRSHSVSVVLRWTGSAVESVKRGLARSTQKIVWFGVIEFICQVLRLRLSERILIGVFCSVSDKFSRSRRCYSRTIYARIVRPVNALQLCRWQFSQKETFEKLCSRLSSSEVQYSENGRFKVLSPPPLWGEA